MGFYTEKITGTAKVAVSVTYGNFRSIWITNSHVSHIGFVDLYLASQVGTDVTDTGANVNLSAGYTVTTSSQAIVVDGVATTATPGLNDDTFLDERVYKSDGTFIGTCTTVHSSGTPLTFSGGLEVALANDVDLYTGTRYYIVKSYSLPVGDSLKLNSNELDFDSETHKLYIKTTAGTLDVISRQ
jgi:hypothetical protein